MATMTMNDKPRETADNLIRVTERLSSLMNQEVELLRGRRARDIRALQSDKESLAAVYQRMMQDLQATPDMLDCLDDGRRKALLRAARTLEESASDNAITLHSAIQVNHRLMEAIADAVKQHSSQDAPYARNGRLAGTAAMTRRATAPSFALNQTL